MRTLTVFSPEGLCNRLRVLTSGMAIAEAAGRTFRMLWPKSATCYATFQELFANDWSVEAGTRNDLARIGPVHEYGGRSVPKILEFEEEHLCVSACSWLLRYYEQFSPRLIGPEIMVANRVDPTDPQRIALIDRTKEFVRQLQPAAHLQRAIDEFRAAKFRPRMIGVHLRRGDYIKIRPDLAGNTQEAMAEVDRILAVEPDAGILLCSDDGAFDVYTKRRVLREGVHEKFRRRYGDRVVWTEQDHESALPLRNGAHAVIDIWLLRSTDYFIGTPLSSFSEMARVGRDVPSVLVAGYVASMRPAIAFLNVTGIAPLLLRYGRHRFKRDVPLLFMLRRIRAYAHRKITGRSHK